MNNLWDHTGAAGAGYAQPAPLVAESELKTLWLTREVGAVCDRARGDHSWTIVARNGQR